MTTISSGSKSINHSDEKVFNFLSSFNNFESLMPDKVVNWKSTEDECSFTVQGMADIGMKINERNPNQTIVINSHGKNPFTFQLFVTISDPKENSCNVELKMEADLNPMLAMMAKRPLGNLLTMMTDELSKLAL